MKCKNYTLTLSMLVFVAMTCINLAIAAPQADLVPQTESMKYGKVTVKNIGKAVSRTSWLTVECIGNHCPEDPAMAAYENTMFANVIAVNISSLKPGQSFSHQLSFWKQLNFKAGKYKFILRADAGSDIPESNEANNIATYIKFVKAAKSFGLSNAKKAQNTPKLQKKSKLTGGDEWPVCIPTIGHTCPP